MPLDFPASGAALWGIYDAGGPRPEYVLPTLYAESGFNPSIQNDAGAANYGVNQASPGLISQYAGTDPDTYTTWAASQQIATVVRGMLLSLVRTYGPLRSGARVEQANAAPSTLSKAKSLSTVVYQFPDPNYSGNHLLDKENKGWISVGDLAAFITPKSQAGKVALQNAIAQTYELRPGEHSRDPILGDDFGGGAGPFALAASLALLLYAWMHRA